MKAAPFEGGFHQQALPMQLISIEFENHAVLKNLFFDFRDADVFPLVNVLVGDERLWKNNSPE